MTGPDRPKVGMKKPSVARPGGHHRFGPSRYIWRQVWGERGRNLLTFLSIAIISSVLTLFLCMDTGLSDHFRDDTGIPTEENKELFEIKEVVGSWSSFMLFLCASLMVLSTANASSMDILERRFELSTLRAIGTRPHQVLLLLLTPLALVVLSGLLAGPLVVLAAISIMGSQPRLPLGPDLGVPLSIDGMTFLMVLGIGTAAALIGTVPSLASVLGRSPMEVLRDAP